MEPTALEIRFALAMLAASVALLLCCRWYLRARSAERMRDMMLRLALNPEVGSDCALNISQVMADVRKRCRRCQAEDVCERWLNGELRGPNTFCPNRRIFKALMKRPKPIG